MTQRTTSTTADLAINLRFLCEQHSSVSTVCRRIGLNRQQFNKYLSGLHVPTPQNLRLIANFFGLSVDVLQAPPEELRGLIEGNFFHLLEKLRTMSNVQKFINAAIVAQKNAASEFCGTYDRYQFSSIYKGMILRSAFCIYDSSEFVQHYYIERFPSHDAPDSTDCIFKYHGFMFELNGRLFTLDFESIQRNELTFGIFAPVRRNSVKLILGVANGIAASASRQPYATKVALHYRRPGLIRRDGLERLTTLKPGDPSIPREISQFLEDGSSMIQIS